MEVYENLVRENPEDPPDLVIGGELILVREEQGTDGFNSGYYCRLASSESFDP